MLEEGTQEQKKHTVTRMTIAGQRLVKHIPEVTSQQ
jgi:hypothetical protein